MVKFNKSNLNKFSKSFKLNKHSKKVLGKVGKNIGKDVESVAKFGGKQISQITDSATGALDSLTSPFGIIMIVIGVGVIGFIVLKK